ncbi:threonine/serine exporter family protein [Limibacterium fermenti]|uniref:threonine/serine exporter family protein n=1 Tax=Limibacterium fermenti TaxID=3229863 RepID=UPI003A78065F
MILELVNDGIFAAIAAVGFGSISYPPKRAFKYIALLAAIGHALRFYLMHYVSMDIATASFFGSLLIGVAALWFGKVSHCPLTVLYIPALLPMIPGIYAYKSVFALVMLLNSLENQELAQQYVHEFMLNCTVTVSVVFMLAVGATSMIFLFPKKAYSMTRKNRIFVARKNEDGKITGFTE